MSIANCTKLISDDDDLLQLITDELHKVWPQFPPCATAVEWKIAQPDKAVEWIRFVRSIHAALSIRTAPQETKSEPWTPGRHWI